MSNVQATGRAVSTHRDLLLRAGTFAYPSVQQLVSGIAILISIVAAGCDRDPPAAAAAATAQATTPAPAPSDARSAGSAIDLANLKPGDFWLAATADERPDSRGDDLLRSMFAAAAKKDSSLGGGIDDLRVVFIYAGQKFGNQWLTFACTGRAGLSAIVFDRPDGSLIDHRGTLYLGRRMMPQALKWTLLKIDRKDLEVRTTFDFDGSQNVIAWSLDPAIGPPPKDQNEPRLESPLICCRTTPLTGWFGAAQGLHGQGDPGNRKAATQPEPQAWQALSPDGKLWYPSVGKVTYIQGAAAAREMEGVKGTGAISFLPDGRLAAASATELKILSFDESKPTVRAMPGEAKRAETVTFSADGTHLFMAGTSRSSWLIDTVEEKTRDLGSWAGRPVVQFPDSRSMVYVDNVSAYRLDLQTGARSPLGLEHVSQFGLGMSGDQILLDRGSMKLELIDLKGKQPARTFPSVQGLHQSSLSPDGRWVVMKGQSGLRIVDARNGEILLDHDEDFDFHTALSCIKWNADSVRGAAAGISYVYVWSLKKPYWFARFPHGRRGFHPDVALSPDGKRMAASAAESETIAYWPDIDAVLSAMDPPKPMQKH